MGSRICFIIVLWAIFGWFMECVEGNQLLSFDNSHSLSQMSDGYRLNKLHHFNDNKMNTSSYTITPDAMEKILSFLLEDVPQHCLSFLIDNNLSDIDTRIKLRGDVMSISDIKSSSDLQSLRKDLSSPVATSPTARRYFIVLCSLEEIVKIFRMIASENLENRMTWWIIFETSPASEKVLQKVLREGSRVLLIQRVSEESFKILSSRIENTGNVKFEEAGYWTKTTSSNDKKFLIEDLFQDVRPLHHNYEGRQLTVTAVDDNPFIVLEGEGDQVRAVAGFEYVIIQSLSKVLNFTFRMVMPLDKKWGGPLPNGTIIGLIGVVARREADFSICEITATGIREKVIDFSYPYYIESLTLVSRTPREKNRSFAAFSPFVQIVWLCIMVSVLFMGTVIYVENSVMENYLQENQRHFSFQNTLFNTFRCLVKQDNLLPIKYGLHKFTFMVWYIFCLIIGVLYSGMLTATIIKPSFEKPINSLIDVPDAVKDGFQLAVVHDTSIEYLFKNAKEGIYAETWNLFDHEERAKTKARHASGYYDAILEDKLILFNGQLSSKYIGTVNGIHQYHFARDTFSPQNYAAVCYSGSPFLPVLNKMLSYMVEGGLISKWVENEFQKAAANNTNHGRKSGSKAFSIKHLQAAFYILLIGFLAGAASLFVEHLTSYLYNDV